jgi:hypothetical protein
MYGACHYISYNFYSCNLPPHVLSPYNCNKVCSFVEFLSSHSQLSLITIRGVYSSIIPPPLGGGKESKGLRAREENQRRVEKMERQREKKRKISVGNSRKSVFTLSKMIFSNFFLILIEI